MNTTIPKLTSRKCYKCGSPMMLMDQITETIPGQYGPVTTSTYKCSNEECQESTDKELEQIKKRKEKNEIATQQRIERISKSRKLAKEKKEQEKDIKI